VSLFLLFLGTLLLGLDFDLDQTLNAHDDLGANSLLNATEFASIAANASLHEVSPHTATSDGVDIKQPSNPASDPVAASQGYGAPYVSFRVLYNPTTHHLAHQSLLVPTPFPHKLRRLGLISPNRLS
jgi:hypothetical protein